jgi:pimeloyl-ACP methyl ester carboxylesterase
MHAPAETPTTARRTESEQRWAGLAGRSHGDPGTHGCPIVLLHGLTFDHHMWGPVIEALPSFHPTIAFDLPGHGSSPSLPRPGLAPVIDAIHAAVCEAQLDPPILVGHSIGGPLAALYAAQYPAAGCLSIDAPIRVEPFAQLLRSLQDQLAGDGFASAWAMFQASWQMELLPAAARALLKAGDRPADERLQRQVLAYQADLLQGSLEEVVLWRDAGMSRLRDAGTPYLTLHSSAVDRCDRAWLSDRLPNAEILVWPVGHHFPHLSDPTRFAAVTGFAAAAAGRSQR